MGIEKDKELKEIIEDVLSGKAKVKFNVIEWYQDGKLHRDNDKQAAIYSNGMKYWIKNGIIHRENDQPAIIYSNGTKEWWLNGKKYK